MIYLRLKWAQANAFAVSVAGAQIMQMKMMHLIRTVGVLCFWLPAMCGAAQASRHCFVPFIRTLNNQTVPGTMYVMSGKRCSLVMLRSRGPTFITRLVAQAEHGHVSVEGNRVVYVSRPGFVGSDHFVYLKAGLDTINRPVSRTVEVSVNVTAGPI